MKAKQRAEELKEIISQRVLADVIGVKPPYLSRWMTHGEKGSGIVKALESGDPIEKAFYTKHNKITISIENR